VVYEDSAPALISAALFSCPGRVVVLGQPRNIWSHFAVDLLVAKNRRSRFVCDAVLSYLGNAFQVDFSFVLK